MNRQKSAIGLDYVADVIEQFSIGYTLAVYMEDSVTLVEARVCPDSLSLTSAVGSCRPRIDCVQADSPVAVQRCARIRVNIALCFRYGRWIVLGWFGEVYSGTQTTHYIRYFTTMVFER